MKVVYDFFKSSYFLLLIFIISLVCWITYKEQIGICIFMAIASFILFTAGPTECLLPLLFNAFFMSRNKISLNEVPIYYVISGLILISAMIFYIVKNKIDIKKPKMKLGFILLAICSVISLINLQTDGENIRYFYSLGNVAFLVVYVFFAATIGKDNGNYLSRIFVFLGMFLALQLIIAGTDNGTFSVKITNLGWGGANTAAIYINMSIIAAFYLISQESKILNICSYFILIVFFIFIICLSLSRAGYVALGACIIPSAFFAFRYSKQKVFLIIFAVFIMFGCYFVYLQMEDILKEIVQKAFEKGLDDNGREEIWEFAMEKFKLHKIIGNGMFGVGIPNSSDTERLMVIHNTFYQCLYSFGILGAISLVIHYIQKYIVVFKRITPFKMFFLIITLSGFIHGMLDNTYFMLVYMLIICPTLAIVETDGIEEETLEVL